MLRATVYLVWIVVGRLALPARGSGTRTVVVPILGGNSVRARERAEVVDERFSCMITTTWRIRWIRGVDPLSSGVGLTTSAPARSGPAAAGENPGGTTTATKPGRIG